MWSWLRAIVVPVPVTTSCIVVPLPFPLVVLILTTPWWASGARLQVDNVTLNIPSVNSSETSFWFCVTFSSENTWGSRMACILWCYSSSSPIVFSHPKITKPNILLSLPETLAHMSLTPSTQQIRILYLCLPLHLITCDSWLLPVPWTTQELSTKKHMNPPP